VVFGLPALLWYGSIFAMHAWRAHYGLPAPVRLRADNPPLAQEELARVISPPAVAPNGAPVLRASLHRSAEGLVWELHQAGGATAVVDAETGTARPALAPAQALTQAAKVFPPAGGARVDLLRGFTLYYYDDDENRLPTYRVRLADAFRTEVYVDPLTGAVTTAMDARGRAYRLWGTMLHFSQFWPLERSATGRNALRVLGLTGNLVGAGCGVLFGLWMVGRRWRSPWPRRGLRAGIRLLHVWLGLGVCVVFVAWAASGYLMFLWYRTGTPTPDEMTRLAERPIAGGGFVAPAEAVAAASRQSGEPVLALGARRLLGRPVYDVVHPDGSATLVDGASGAVSSPVPDSLIREVVARFLGHAPEIRSVALLRRYDAYYYGAMPGAPRLPVYRVDLARSDDPSPVYVDAASGELVGRVDRAYRVFRWVGQGVHTLDFPPLQDHPRWRDLAVLLPALCGTLLSLTGLWLGVDYLMRLARRTDR
jgi:hypothetical protein